jgi:ABC-type lipoprotein release transport system permease subunit
VIGPKTAADLGVGIGDTVTIGSAPRAVRIVGHGLFPQDVHSEFDEGLWITAADLEQAEPEGTPAYDRADAIAIRVEPDADVAQVAAEIGEAAGSDYIVTASEVPQELTNLQYVRTLPIVLAVFLGLLALAALLHVLMTVVRTRRSEFAVLRALGMTRRSTRAVVSMQGTSVAVIGLVVGIPLGVLLGHQVWNWISESVPLERVAVSEWVVLVLVAAVALGAADLLALWPGRRAARLQPAEALRRE